MFIVSNTPLPVKNFNLLWKQYVNIIVNCTKKDRKNPPFYYISKSSVKDALSYILITSLNEEAFSFTLTIILTVFE